MPELKLENSLVDNRYEVIERLSRGSFAEIFVARDREAGLKEVVIKALNTSLQGTPDADLERTLVENFQNEAEALDAVRHPHVILRWGHGTAADLRNVRFHYLVLEYMPGGDLLKLCRDRPGNALPLDEALLYFKQACEALAYAHSKGIIHRDLKPNNLLLSADHRTLKIADFGVAKITTGEDAEITRVGADIYAPPEHHPGEESGPGNRLTASADIYSLAKSFYTVVCGRAPGEFKCDPITWLPGEVANERWAEPLLAVLRRATDDDPKARYASVVEFWSELAQVAAVRDEGKAEEKADELSDTVEDETMVRPRLKVAPGALPAIPAQPDFDLTLSSARPRVGLSTATLVEERGLVEEQKAEELKVEEPKIEERVAENGELREAPVDDHPQLRDNERPPKFFIKLREPKPAPAARTQVRQEPLAKRNDQVETKPPTQAEAKAAEAKTAKEKVTDKFNQRMRLRIFVGLLALTFLGSMLTVYNYVRRQDAPIGFGPATEIEVLASGLNVRLEPNGRILGVVAKGSRHRVLTQVNQDWIQIEVGQWSELFAHAETNKGWVYGKPDGNSPNVRVVSRRLW
jgi:serine/threonine protein kinase